MNFAIRGRERGGHQQRSHDHHTEDDDHREAVLLAHDLREGGLETHTDHGGARSHYWAQGWLGLLAASEEGESRRTAESSIAKARSPLAKCPSAPSGVTVKPTVTLAMRSASTVVDGT